MTTAKTKKPVDLYAQALAMSEKRAARGRKPGARTGKPTGLQIPYDLLEWLDAHVTVLGERWRKSGVDKQPTRTDVIVTALRQYQEREDERAFTEGRRLAGLSTD